MQTLRATSAQSSGQKQDALDKRHTAAWRGWSLIPPVSSPSVFSPLAPYVARGPPCLHLLGCCIKEGGGKREGSLCCLLAPANLRGTPQEGSSRVPPQPHSSWYLGPVRHSLTAQWGGQGLNNPPETPGWVRVKGVRLNGRWQKPGDGGGGEGRKDTVGAPGAEADPRNQEQTWGRSAERFGRVEPPSQVDSTSILVGGSGSSSEMQPDHPPPTSPPPSLKPPLPALGG